MPKRNFLKLVDMSVLFYSMEEIKPKFVKNGNIFSISISPFLMVALPKSGGRVFNSGAQGMVRLITPLRMHYEDSYAKAFPFDKLVEGMLNPRMIEDTVNMMLEAIKKEKKVAITINNRAGGNGPLIAQQIAKRFLDLYG